MAERTGPEDVPKLMYLLNIFVQFGKIPTNVPTLPRGPKASLLSPFHRNQL